MARLQFEQSVTQYKFRVPPLPSKTEFNNLKQRVKSNPNLEIGTRVEVNYMPAVLISLLLLFSAGGLVLLLTGKFEFQDPIMNVVVIIVLIIVVIALGASGFVFNKINELRAQNYPNKYYKSLKRMVISSRNYNEFVKMYTEKYYRGVSPRELRDEIAYINRNEN